MCLQGYSYFVLVCVLLRITCFRDRNKEVAPVCRWEKKKKRRVHSQCLELHLSSLRGIYGYFLGLSQTVRSLGQGKRVLADCKILFMTYLSLHDIFDTYFYLISPVQIVVRGHTVFVSILLDYLLYSRIFSTSLYSCISREAKSNNVIFHTFKFQGRQWAIFLDTLPGKKKMEMNSD